MTASQSVIWNEFWSVVNGVKEGGVVGRVLGGRKKG